MNPTREASCRRFLAEAGWGDAGRRVLAAGVAPAGFGKKAPTARLAGRIHRLSSARRCGQSPPP